MSGSITAEISYFVKLPGDYGLWRGYTQMMISALKKVALKAGNSSGLFRLMRTCNRGGLILFYHGVAREICDAEVQYLHMPFDNFRRQIDYLMKGFQLISAAQLVERFAHARPFSGREVHLTFDDGYRNNLTVVAPYLHERAIPFTVFVSTRHVDDGGRFPGYLLKTAFQFSEQATAAFPSLGTRFDLSQGAARRAAERSVRHAMKSLEQARVREIVRDIQALLPAERWRELDARFDSDGLMSWSEVRELARLGATIGSHCHDHAIMHSKQPRAEVEAQLGTSRARIEQETGQECTHLAFPNGSRADISGEALALVKQQGYRLAYTTVAGDLQADINPYLLPRAPAPWDLERFKCLVNTSWLLQYQHRHREWMRGYAA